MTWYSNMKFGDPFKHQWKYRIKKKGLRGKENKKHHEKFNKPDPSTVLFVPSTEGGKLLTQLEEEENNLLVTDKINWTMKMVEKSGSPLLNLFGVRFPINEGCPLGQLCTICDNDAVKCNTKGIVYEVTCLDCNKVPELDENTSRLNPMVPRYIGESSRPLRMRAHEHWSNLRESKNESFMLIHWMQCHGLQMQAPRYKFKKLGTFGDSLSRQVTEAVLIEQYGNLNKKSEFGINHLSRLDVSKSEEERDYLLGKEAEERANLTSNLECFKLVLDRVRKFDTETTIHFRSKDLHKTKKEEWRSFSPALR